MARSKVVGTRRLTDKVSRSWISAFASSLLVPVLLFASTGVRLPSGSGGDEKATSGRYTDPRDSKGYSWVLIGSQVWMAENLRYVPETGWKCWNDDEAECGTKGAFYDWKTAMEASPPGWHLPSDEEWKILEQHMGIPDDELDVVGLDRANDIGSTMKKEDCWPKEYDGAPIEYSNDTGFSAVPTGFFALGDFTHSGHAGWWTSTPEGDKAWVRALGFHNNMITRSLNDQRFLFPIRCVRDAEPGE
jgi:uncharacterized protein (TIGR02145 family)